MNRFQRLSLVIGAMFAWLALAEFATAQDAPTPQKGTLADLEQTVSSLQLSLLRAQAKGDEIKEEQKLLDDAAEGVEPVDFRRFSAPEDVWDDVFEVDAHSGGDSDALNRELAKSQKNINDYQNESEKTWSSLNAQLLEMQEKHAEFEDRIGWRMGSKPSGSTIPMKIIGAGLLAILGGLVLLVHETRDRMRWRLRSLGSRPSMLILAVVLPLAAACGAWTAPPDDAAGKPKTAEPAGGIDGLKKELAQKCADLTQLVSDKEGTNTVDDDRLAKTLEGIRRARAAYSMKPDTQRQKALVDQAEATEATIQRKFRDVRVAARVTSLALGDAERIEKQLKSLEDRLASFVLGSRDGARSISLVRLGSCGLFILCAAIPLLFVRRRRRRDRSEQARKCPRCLNKDTLDFIASSSDKEFDEGQTMFRLKECNACQYEIRENYVDHNRLCFPTVGIRASGKTHWLLMLYDLIKNSNIPVASAIKKIPAREDKVFDALVKQLLFEAEGPSATVLGLPYPITFHVNDADPLGANRSMVNLFDYSGELQNWDIDTNAFRRRALLCDGFTLFLDPTQVSQGSSSAIESQIEGLTKFAEEMHAIRGLPTENPIDLPIAVCVSKIDLLVTRNPMGTQAIPLVTALRETLTRKVDLSLIHERSQLCARILSQIFPGWNVERSLRENFGGRYMFFPMSAVGLEEAELGVEDLRQRMIVPCGIIEPLLWLLHMHGYCVLH
jgi:hypothetical protein